MLVKRIVESTESGEFGVLIATFLEVEQPVSQFVFRMKDGPRAAIFEADGGAWRNQAIVNIREYLKEQLAEEVESQRITILAIGAITWN